MSPVAPIVVLCCLALLGLGAVLGIAIDRRPNLRATAYHGGGSSATAIASLPVTRFLHPRMDLAAGRAPNDQAIDLDLRRLRHQLSESFTIPSEPASAFEPFDQRRRQPRPLRQRLDLVYARDTMGDLSDPVCRKRLAA